MIYYQFLFDGMLISDLTTVVKVAEFQSIKRASDYLDMSVATVSAAVKRVEKEYDIELFVRSTRRLRVSSTGEKYLPHIANAITLLNKIEQNVKAEQDIIGGELRLAVPSDLGRNIILPLLDKFMEQHQKIQINLHISDKLVDFYRDPVDIALRYGAPKDSNMYGFKICDISRVICASPSYIEKAQQLKHPNDLKKHNGLLYLLSDITHDVWEFSKDSEVIKTKVKGNRIANDADLVRRWCKTGYGVALKSELDISNELLSGELVSLLNDYKAKSTELWLICPTQQLITPEVRLLRDFIKKNCLATLAKLNNFKAIQQ